MALQTKIVSPYLRSGMETRGMMAATLGCLSFTAVHFAVRYDPVFFWRYAAALLFALGVDIGYHLLKDGRLKRPAASVPVTAALLVLSVPSRMPPVALASGIAVAVLFGKCMVDRRALRLNPMLLGRLFMMLVFADAIQQWRLPGAGEDAITSATVLGLWFSEGATTAWHRIMLGRIGGTWEGFVALLPGSPGEMMPLISLGAGLLLYFAGVVDWRPGVAFVAGFAGACLFLDMPVLFHVLSGAVIFTAVYIVTDPRSMPGSKGGRLVLGALAGILNAFIRNHGYYPEGVVFAVLAVNLLSPTLDRVFFFLRGRRLRKRARARKGGASDAPSGKG